MCVDIERTDRRDSGGTWTPRRLGRTAVPLAVAALLATALVLPVVAEGRGNRPAGPRDEALVELGRRLFFDPIVSRSGARSCASCHDPEHGFSDPAVVSEDDIGLTRRHSQTLLDAAHNPSAHWDGEFDTIEDLVIARLGLVDGQASSRSHGASLAQVATELASAARPAATPAEAASAAGESDGHAPDGETAEAPEEAEPSPTTTSPGDQPGGGGVAWGGYSVPESAPTPQPTTPPDNVPTPGGGDDAPAPPGAPHAQSGGAPAAGESALTPSRPPPGHDRDRDLDRRARRLRIQLARDLARLPRVQDVLEQSGRYDEAFQAAFGSRAVTTSRLAKAIAAYCRTIEHTPSPYDRFRDGVAALDADRLRGLQLFEGRAGCAQCHTLGDHTPRLTDFAYHNTGVAWLALSEEERAKLKRRAIDERLDKGREVFSARPRDRRAFKTPTLRDLTRRGPYMHDGRFERLADVVRYYAGGGSDDPRQDGRIRPFVVTDRDVECLVAFLGSLTGDERPGLAARAWSVRPSAQRVRLVDGRGRALAGLPVQLVPVGDVLPASPGRRVRTLTTDADGSIEFLPPPRTHTQLVLPQGLTAEGGLLVPDTCRSATVRVPVDGQVTLLLALPPDRAAPGALVAEHEGTIVLPGHQPPRTELVLTHEMDAGGARVVRYVGWRRTDVPPVALVRLPGARPDADGLRVSLGRRPARLDLR